jgi:polyhydroxyalkanoate synthesis regulator phasin
MKEHLIQQAKEYCKIYFHSTKESLIYTMVEMYKLTREEAEQVYTDVIRELDNEMLSA